MIGSPTPEVGLCPAEEVEIAIQRQLNGEMEVFPVLVGGAAMPRRKGLANRSRGKHVGRLPDYQAHTFLGNQADWDHQFERLRKRLARVPGVPEARFQAPYDKQHTDTIVHDRSHPSFRSALSDLPSSPNFQCSICQTNLQRHVAGVARLATGNRGPMDRPARTGTTPCTASARGNGGNGANWRAWRRQIGHPCPARGTAFRRGSDPACDQGGWNTPSCGDTCGSG